MTGSYKYVMPPGRRQQGGAEPGEGRPRMGNMKDLLEKHFLGEFDLTLRNVTCTDMVRETSARGLKQLEISVRSKGWLKQFAPTVIIDNGSIPDGGLLSAAAAAVDLRARVLDGNHRVKTCKALFGEDSTITCRVYKEFDNPADLRLIADCECCPCLLPSSFVYGVPGIG